MKNEVCIRDIPNRAGARVDTIENSSGRIFYRGFVLMGSLLLASVPAAAQNGSPGGPPSDDQPTFMKLLTDEGLHDIENESWNAYGQSTYVSNWKLAFPAAYTNLNGSINSLLPNAEQSFTGTATLYLGVRLWSGAEGYVVPEVISELPFDQLRGLGGAIQNSELQKGGTETPQVYHSRLFLKQTFGFGGERIKKESGPMQLGTTYDSRRLVLVAGNFSILDFFDKNAFDIDPRQSFLSLAYLTCAAWDFASDARGYSYGGVAEFYWDDWAVRLGRITPPKNPNQLPVDFRLFKYYGDQIELEHNHQIHGREGTVRLLAYRNHEDIGRFADAIAVWEADPAKNATTCTGFNYGSNNAGAPDLCWARKPNTKVGAGMFAQQYIANDIGLFARGMYSDGKSEVDAYTSADRSATFGLLARGSSWRRPRDVAGVGFDAEWISKIHAEYLALGGIDGFIGDGAITQGAETSFDAFYSVAARRWLWLTGDYQHIFNPGFNQARGPVNVFSLRLHGEF
jgi:high affinity Mn2+ porin